MNKKVLLGCILGAVVIALTVSGVLLFTNKECSHSFSDWTVITEATCENVGEKQRTCSECGEVEKTEIVALGHDWQEANCKAPKTCARCAKTEGDVGDHSFTKEAVSDEAIKAAATCEHAALYFKSCEYCGKLADDDTAVFEYGEKLAHDYSKEEVKEEALKTAATCTQKGVYYKSCAACGTVSTSESDVFEGGEFSAHAFTVEDAKPSAANSSATCSAAATYFKSCEVCGTVSESLADTFTFGTPNGHSYVKEVKIPEALKHEATCTEAKTYYKSCSKCGSVGRGATFTDGDPLGHEFTQTVLNENTKKASATCSVAATYYKSCARCDAVSDSESDVFTNGTAASHDYSVENEEADGALKSNATCTSAAVYYKSCSMCGAVSNSLADTFTYGDPIAHTYDQTTVKTEAKKSAATCTEKAKYYKSCACGAVSASESDVFENGEPNGHNRYAFSTKDATCENKKEVTYRCRNCTEYESIEEEGEPLGHDIAGVTAVEKRVGNTCNYTEYYACKREGCGKEVAGDIVAKHSYVASITTAATCKEKGEKTLTCTNPNCTDATATEEIAIDTVNGHSWIIFGGTGTSSGEVTYMCAICSKTKAVIKYSGNTSDATAASDLKGKEIELADASVSFDDATADGIDGNVTLSVGKVEGDARNDIDGVDADMLEQVGDNPIYNFELNNGAISQFDGKVTVRIPYTLAEGENVDNIAVWYIAADGTLKSIKATYNNGYISFETDHFSYYTVTRLTPAERCALYGHSYSTTKVNGGCVSDSYDLFTCIRCHDVKKENVVAAPGHDYAKSVTAATCLENGYTEYKCSNCDASYKTTIPARGHKYEENKGAAVASTCTAAGSKKYECSGCDSEYTVAQPLIEHSIITEPIAPTCDNAGYTLYSCENCSYSIQKDFVSALGHEYDYDDDQKTVWKWDGLSVGNASLGTGISASATFCCVREGCTHAVEDLAASISFKFEYGVCSQYVKITVTAAVAFENGVRYDEKDFTIGDENHKFAQSYKYDEANHWHECICGARADVTSHDFSTLVSKTEPTCAKSGTAIYSCGCGARKTEEIPATGNHSYKDGACEYCGSAIFYTNLVRSHERARGYEFVVENFSLNGISISVDDGSVTKQEIAKQLDIIKFVIYFENGELKGEGVAKLKIKDYGIDVIFDCVAYIENGNVYLKYDRALAGDEEINTSELACMSTEYLFETVVRRIFGYKYYSVNWRAVKMLEEFCGKYVKPAIQAVTVAYPNKVEALLSGVFNMAFTREKTENGYKLTLDYDKLLALNEALAQKPVSEVIDLYFGNGTFDKVTNFVLAALNVELKDVPAKLEAIGIKKQNVFAAVIKLKRKR